MKISVVIPALNEEENIRKFLEQFQGVVGNFEVLLIDGKSTDRTFSIAQEYAKKSPFSLQVFSSEKTGRSHQMNFGAQKSSGEVLLFLHADTFLPKDAFEKISLFLKNTENIGGAFRLQFIEKNFLLSCISIYSNLRAKYTAMFHGDQALFLRKKIFTGIGGFQNIRVMEDVAMSRAMRKYGKIQQLPLPVRTSARRIQANGVIKSIFYYFLLKSLFQIGAPPSTIASVYKRLKKDNKR